MTEIFTRIRWRLVAWNVLILSLILIVLGLAVYISLSRSLQAQVDRNLQSSGNDVATKLREISEGDLQLGREGYQGTLFYLVLDTKGTILANPQHVNMDTTDLRYSFERPSSFQTVTIDGEPTRLYIRPIIGRGSALGVFITGQSLVPEEAALHRLLLILLAGGIAGMLLSLAGAWFLAGRALIPIERSFVRQQEFVADASHELRTPLTVLHSAVDLLNQHRAEPLEANGELFDDLRQEISRMERLATDLLTLARGDLNQLALAVGEVNLAALTEDVVRRTMPLARERGITLASVSDGSPSDVEVDPDRFQQVLLILLDNALKHTPQGGRISVAVKRQGTDVTLTVADTGEGIPSEHLPRVFDRFYRVDRARSRAQGSTGLGLAIAKSLIDAHGGQLSLSSVPGSGTVATVRLRSTNITPSLAGRVGQFASRIAHRPSRQ